MAPKNNRRGRRVDEDSDDESASLKALRTDEAELQSQPQVQKKTSKKKQVLPACMYLQPSCTSRHDMQA